MANQDRTGIISSGTFTTTDDTSKVLFFTLTTSTIPLNTHAIVEMIINAQKSDGTAKNRMFKIAVGVTNDGVGVTNKFFLDGDFDGYAISYIDVWQVYSKDPIGVLDMVLDENGSDFIFQLIGPENAEYKYSYFVNMKILEQEI